MKPKVLIVLGPTATGKSNLAVKLANKFRAEVISADSRQVYKGLDIGTGKITTKEMRGVPHHLLDVADPKKVFSVSDYKTLVKKSLVEIIKKNKLPIVVGGSGFYIDTLRGQTTLPNVPPNKKLRKELESKSAEELFDLLKKKDPQRAETIDRKNKVRLIRALEIIEKLGTVPSPQLGPSSDFEFIFIGLSLPQEELDIKIKKRLIERIEEGMIQEAKYLHQKGLSYTRMNSLGLEYRHLALFLQNKITKEEMVGKLFTEIRRYSKRQTTWFKTNKKINWFNPKDTIGIEKFVKEKLRP